jgi:hypothetical protein
LVEPQPILLAAAELGFRGDLVWWDTCMGRAANWTARILLFNASLKKQIDFFCETRSSKIGRSSHLHECIIILNFETHCYRPNNDGF